MQSDIQAPTMLGCIVWSPIFPPEPKAEIFRAINDDVWPESIDPAMLEIMRNLCSWTSHHNSSSGPFAIRFPSHWVPCKVKSALAHFFVFQLARFPLGVTVWKISHANYMFLM
jgi:hypothetical protein